MLRIYGVYRSRASRVLWLAHELGLPFELIPVMQRYRLKDPVPADVVHTRSPSFSAVNPNGHIPSIDDDGLVLHESLAITLYLAKKHGGPLAPRDLAEDARMTMWALWAATEVEAQALAVLYNGPNDPAAEALRAPFHVLDRALEATGWLVGDRFTVADLNVAEVVRYASGAQALFDASPSVKRWLAACHTRPAFQRMWQERDKEPA
ncbi:MAG: glutathione S-transferase family protein [Reyranellaceae bacterium]